MKGTASLSRERGACGEQEMLGAGTCKQSWRALVTVTWMKSALEPFSDVSGLLHGLWAATRFQQKHNMTNSYGTSHVGVT